MGEEVYPYLADMGRKGTDGMIGKTATSIIVSFILSSLLVGEIVCAEEAAVNLLTNPALDPIAKIPEYKVCAVRVEAA